MAEGKGFNKYVWLIVMILSIVFLVFTIIAMSSGGEKILETGLERYADSSFDIDNLDEAANGFLSMSMLKPLWEEIWIGILGIFCALGIKKGKKYAWILGIFWGVMLLIDGAIQGGYELFILDWSSPCAQTYIFLVLGIIGLASLLIARRKGILLE